MKNILYILFTILIIAACNDFDIEDQGFDLEPLPESVAFDGSGDNWNASTVGAEGDTVTLSVEAAAGTLADIQVTYSLGGTAEFGVDYSIAGATAAGGSVTIEHDPGDFNEFDMGDIRISLLSDNNNTDSAETIIVTLVSATRDGESIAVGRGGTRFGQTATVTISNRSLEFSLSTSSISRVESAVTDTITFFASLNFAASSALTYDLTLFGASLTATTDYNIISTSGPGTGLTIAAGQTSDTVTIVLVDDGTITSTGNSDGQDSLNFALQNVAIASGDIATGTDTLTVFVQDDALKYGFDLTADTVLTARTTYNFTISLVDTLSATASAAFTDLTIPYTLGGTAVEGDDYADVTGGSVTILAGEASSVLSIQVLDVGDNATNLTLPVTLGTPTASPAEVLGVAERDDTSYNANGLYLGVLNLSID